jgi:P-type conjugative transfer protein TrbJ
VLTTLKAAGSQSSQITGAEDQLLQTLQSQAESAGGTMQALQVGNEVSLQTVRQLQKLRQLVLADLQLKANFIQTQQDKETSQAAAWKQFSNRVRAARDGNATEMMLKTPGSRTPDGA